MFNTSEKNAYTKNLDMKKHWFNTNELTRYWSWEDGEDSLSLFPKRKNLTCKPKRVVW